MTRKYKSNQGHHHPNNLSSKGKIVHRYNPEFDKLEINKLVKEMTIKYGKLINQ